MAGLLGNSIIKEISLALFKISLRFIQNQPIFDQNLASFTPYLFLLLYYLSIEKLLIDILYYLSIEKLLIDIGLFQVLFNICLNLATRSLPGTFAWRIFENLTVRPQLASA